jgi:hypothetical protein
MLQRFGIIKDEKQVRWAFFEECPGLLFHQVPNVLVERGEPGRRCYPFLLPQSCCLVVQGIDDRGEEETRPVVVELDELPPALRRKMKIPSAEKANLWAP